MPLYLLVKHASDRGMPLYLLVRHASLFLSSGACLLVRVVRHASLLFLLWYTEAGFILRDAYVLNKDAIDNITEHKYGTQIKIRVHYNQEFATPAIVVNT